MALPAWDQEMTLSPIASIPAPRPVSDSTSAGTRTPETSKVIPENPSTAGHLTLTHRPANQRSSQSGAGPKGQHLWGPGMCSPAPEGACLS